MSKLVNDEN
jgi:hypothetical protein